MSDDAAQLALKARQQNKLLKEGFVTGHQGSTIGEINLVALILPVAVFTWSVLQSKKRFFEPYGYPAFLVDWLINCASVLAVLTVYSGQPGLLNGLILLPAIAALLGGKVDGKATAKSKAKTVADEQKEQGIDELPMKPFVTMYRGSMMVVTCIAILAVDFRAFPRRFAKVEHWGTSLMDLGVGSFVFSAGVVGARSILKNRTLPPSQQAGLLSRLKSSLRSSLALLALGIARTISVKGVDYAEHVTEYGVHWNFFFTLGLLPPFVAVFQSFFESFVPSYLLLALITTVIHEIILDNTSLTAFIVSGHRDGLISANREGLSSFAGYLAIFLAGQGAGMFALPRGRDSMFSERGWMRQGVTVKRLATNVTETVAGRLGLHAILYIGLFVLATSYQGFNLRVSRQLANLPYVLWVCAFNSAQLVLCVLTERLLFPNIYITAESSTSSSSKSPRSPSEEQASLKFATSSLLSAFNANSLFIFLVANLLTGLVNMSLDTLRMSTLPTMAVLTAYIGVLAGLAVALDVYGIRIKI
jgi:glucosaminylphosphatidylinositol acyltransferase